MICCVRNKSEFNIVGDGFPVLKRRKNYHFAESKRKILPFYRREAKRLPYIYD